MESTLLEGPRRRLPHRTCALCGRPEDATTLGKIGPRRICEDCYRAQVAAPLGPGADEDPDPFVIIRRVDAIFRYGATAIRLGLYTILYLLARNTDFGPHVLSGFLLADGVTWIAAVWLDRRFHSLAVAFEAFVYMGIIALHINFTGGFQMPEGGKMVRSDEIEALDKRKKHTVEAVVDRLSVNEELTERLTESVEAALALGKGTMIANTEASERASVQ